ncbi:MAG TPA: two-component regulator propeller domain-containing protein [Acidisarcina sp.]
MRQSSTIAGSIRRLLLVLLLPAVAQGLDRQQDLGHFGHQSWQTENGLPQNTVRAVLQTRDGYLWLATDGGLVRFDGAQFVVFDKQSPAGLRSNAITALLEDRSGALWIGTTDGLVRRRGAEFTSFTTADGLPANNVSGLYQDRGGSLWILTSGGAAVLKDRTDVRPGAGSRPRFGAVAGAIDLSSNAAIAQAADGSMWIGGATGVFILRDGERVSPPAGLAALETEALAAAADGSIWIGTRSGVEVVSSAGQITTLDQRQGLPADDVTTLLADSAARVWIGTARGLVLLQNGRTAKYGVKDGLPGEHIQAIYSDREGAIWVSTNRGVARFDAGHFSAFGPRDGLSGNVVLSMLEDREGSLWLGTESGGLTVLRDQKFTTYTAASGLSEDLVRSVYQDRAGVLWIGTNGGGLDRGNGSTPDRSAGGPPAFTNLSTANGLSSNIVLAIADDHEGSLWVGTPDGLDRIRNGHVTVFTSADGLADDFVRSIYTAADGTIWIGTRRGLSHLKDGRFTSYTRMDGLGSDLVGALLEQHQRLSPAARSTNGASRPAALWIGTLGGLSRLEDGRFTTLTTRDGLSSNIVTALYEDTDGALWIGTSGGGLDRLRNGVVTSFASAAAGLPENIYAILEDGRGDLWLSSDKGIYRVAVRDLDEFAAGRMPHLMPAVYGTADGMAIRECSSGGHPSATRLRDGSLVFATLKGISLIDPQHASVNNQSPPVAIEQVSFDDYPVDAGAREGEAVNQSGEDVAAGTLKIPPGQGRLAFEYTAMSFVAPQKVRFRYMLEGFDRGWVDAGSRRTAFYTNIPPGHYSFHVVACNNDGVWNDSGAILRFQLRPHLYQTWTFRLLVLLLLGLTAALVAYTLYRRRVQRVEAQFGAVLAERGRIAREIHDTLAQSLVAISVQLEVVARLMASSADTAREHLNQARALTRTSLTEARSSIWDLRSSAGTVTGDAADEDLATRMSSMAGRVTAATAIKIQSKVGGAYHPLPAKLEGELLRIAQEAVTNAVRHANAEHITIDLRFATRLLTMTVADDGCGFSGQPHPESSGPDGHFGLTGMRERAAGVGGSLQVESAPGEGTRVRVEVPID